MKRPTEGQVLDLLSEPGFRRPNFPMPSTDPLTDSLLQVSVSEIDFYEFNPRRSKNEKYEQIKESIRVRGRVDHPISITRRPGESRFIVYMGGNTRLKATKELLAETGDPRFQKIEAVFEPWPGRESDAVIGHLRENDFHGYLILIDRALAIRRARTLLEEELGEPGMSVRRFLSVLQEKGYSLSAATVSWLDYALDVLHPCIPQALDAGMGRPAIEKIKEIGRAFHAAWCVISDQNEQDASTRDLFQEVLFRHDDAQIDLASLRSSLEEELSVTFDWDLSRVALIMGSAMDGRTVQQLRAMVAPFRGSAPDLESTPEGSGPEYSAGADETPTSHQNLFQNGAGSPPTPPPPTTSSAPPAAAAPVVGDLELKQEVPPVCVGSDGAWTESEAPEKHSHGAKLPSDLKSLRARAWTLASFIGSNNLLTSDIVTPIRTGYGFLVGPIGDSSWFAIERLAKGNPDLIKQVGYIWWWLVEASGQFAPDSQARDYLPKTWMTTPVGQALLAEDHNQFIQASWQSGDQTVMSNLPLLAMDGLGQSALFRMTDESWAWCVQLIDTCRRIANLTEHRPWSTARV